MRWGGSGGTRKKAFALLETGLACAQRGDAAAALRSWNEAQGLFEEIDDLFGASQAFDMSATVHANAGRPREAISSWRRALDMQRTLKDAHQEGLLLAKLAAVLCDVGQLHEA